MKNYLQILINVTKAEKPFVLLLSFQFFLIIKTFWILKSLKKILFIQHYHSTELDFFFWKLNAAQTEILAKNLNMFVALVAALLLILLSKYLSRKNLFSSLCALLCLLLTVAVFLFKPNSSTFTWFLYLLGDMFNMLLVAGFFAMLNDTIHPHQVKRLFGPIILGGIIGGVLGSSMYRQLIDILPTTTWLIIAITFTILIAFLGIMAQKYSKKHPDIFNPESKLISKKANSLLKEGANLLSNSAYLFSLASIVVLYEITSTIIDYQFTNLVILNYSSNLVGAYFANVYTGANILSLVIQLFLTGLFLSKSGVSKTLLILPAFLLVGSLGMLILPVLAMGTFLSICDNSLHNSIHQSSKEALYTVADRNNRYQAKAFIDIFIQRSAKTFGLVITFALTTLLNPRMLAFITIIVVLFWIISAYRTGRQFNSRSARIRVPNSAKPSNKGRKELTNSTAIP